MPDKSNAATAVSVHPHDGFLLLRFWLGDVPGSEPITVWIEPGTGMRLISDLPQAIRQAVETRIHPMKIKW